MKKKLSIIIPVFNEESTVDILLQKVAKVKLINNVKKELIILNDGSTDNSKEKIELFVLNNKDQDIKYIENKVNKGKGFAVRHGIQVSTGDFILIQDADLEYDPEDYNKLLKLVLAQDANVVYGSRFLNKCDYKKSYWGHKIINKGITLLSNLLTGMYLTDIQTCYKLFDVKTLMKLDLFENRFSFDHEITARLSNLDSVNIKEVPISYNGRKYTEKKIGWKDGFCAIYAILKYNVFIKIRKKIKKQISVDDFALGISKISI